MPISNIQKNVLPGRVIKDIPEAYLNVAKGMEQQFIQFMIEQMKKTVDMANPESSALKFYQSILDNHHANIMADKNNGKGLQKVILDQIYPAHKRVTSRRHGVDRYTNNIRPLINEKGVKK